MLSLHMLVFINNQLKRLKKRLFKMIFGVIVLLIILASKSWADTDKPLLRIGSKIFAESHILAEITTQLLSSHNYPVEHVHGLGGTLIVYQALLEKDIDIYPEYTGTISQTILKSPDIQTEAFNDVLKQKKLQFFSKFGFNNSYAIAISKQVAQQRNIESISDLSKHTDLEIAFSLEFLKREDGWPALSRHYNLKHHVRGIEHALAYQAIKSKQLSVTDAYITDGEIDTNDLYLLHDDLQFFPTYHAGLLARETLPKPVIKILNQLSGKIDDKTMQKLNRRVSVEKQSPKIVARDFLLDTGLINIKQTEQNPITDSILEGIVKNTINHLKMTAVALILACMSAIPLALLLSQYESLARGVLYLSGLVQTIPSLALLALMIPVFGLGELTAIIALFLYSILPIFRNTLTGLFTVDPLLKQVAKGMGLTIWQQLWKIELPLAIPQIIAGVKTAAIICIGTATLAAFVGAGGLGEPIITGLTLNDHSLILQGAIPAALLAIVTEFLFERLEKFSVPAHLINR